MGRRKHFNLSTSFLKIFITRKFILDGVQHLFCRLSLQQLANEENLRKQEESVQKQEAMRRGEGFVQLCSGWEALWSPCADLCVLAVFDVTLARTGKSQLC